TESARDIEDCVYVLLFFFQAEDGIRDWSVTGVQTCALPIYMRPEHAVEHHFVVAPPQNVYHLDSVFRPHILRRLGVVRRGEQRKIGRASCRERVEMSGGAVSLKGKNRRHGRRR